MNEYLLILLSSVWLGILTSISPCPLATNIAAISYVGKKSEHRKYILISGLLYTVGRVFVYVCLAFIIVLGLHKVPHLSHFLQTQMGKILGPILIITGMFLVGLFNINLKGFNFNNGLQGRIDKLGVLAALPLGSVFALSFCPVSAAIFFGSLIPLALKYNSKIIIPSLYGIGTALPVIIFAFIMAFAAHLLGRVFHKITEIEIWMRKITGVVFILVGIYFSLVYIFGISI